jgi:hypothetical protein
MSSASSPYAEVLWASRGYFGAILVIIVIPVQVSKKRFTCFG